MAAPMLQKPRQWYGKCLVVFLVLSTARAQLASTGNKHDSSAFYDGMEELLQPETESAHSSVEVDRTSAPGDPEPKRTEDSVPIETDSGRQESYLAAEVDRTDSSLPVESEKPERSDRESDRTEGSLAVESEREAGSATEPDRTLVSQDVESDVESSKSFSTSESEGSTVSGLEGTSSNVGSEGTTDLSGDEADRNSESPNMESGETPSVEEPQENSGVDQGDVTNQTLPVPVIPDNTTGGNGTADQPVEEAGSKPAPKKVSCAPRDLSDGDSLSVKVVNGSELIHVLKATQNAAGNGTAEGDCVLIMFYAAWCPFSAAAAPAYHALPRAFPSIRVLAIDAIANSHLNTRFGTVAVPNIMLFYNGKALSRFNQSERSLEQLRMFVKNHTGLDGDPSVEIRPEDFDGPLPTAPSHEPDYFLWASWAFVATFGVVAMTRSSPGKRLLVRLGVLVPVQHQHAD
ncbi:protein rtoA-like [Branchiostoma lanceolatum]|uniref:protein rtoA-like n=1 Tax=Branchiostoma lanceolatum TaxID=7740 RepID=UPI003453E12E